MLFNGMRFLYVNGNVHYILAFDESVQFLPIMSGKYSFV